MRRPLGWVHGLEGELGQRLRRESPRFALAGRKRERPEELDPRPYMTPIEDQQSYSSCGGHAGSTACEFLALAGGRGGRRATQLSRRYAYVAAQLQNNLRGDQGCTISGLVRALQSKEAGGAGYGICREELCPYWPAPGQYSQELPRAAVEEGRRQTVRAVAYPRGYEEVLDALGNGYAVVIGIPWFRQQCTNCPPDGRIERWGGAIDGYHALCWIGYVRPAWEKRARPWVIMPNSHGTRWGAQGYGYCSPEFVAQACDHAQSEVIAISELEGFVYRDVSFRGMTG